MSDPRDSAERVFHKEVSAFGFKGKINGVDGAWVFEVQIPRKCDVVFKSQDRAAAAEWAKNNAR